MPTHNGHDDIRDHGLADDCPRCAEMSEDPFTTLDATNLRNLIERTLDDRFSYYGGELHARSNAEACAMALVMTRLEQTGQLLAAAPGMVVAYAVDRWRIPMEVVS